MNCEHIRAGHSAEISSSGLCGFCWKARAEKAEAEKTTLEDSLIETKRGADELLERVEKAESELQTRRLEKQEDDAALKAVFEQFKKAESLADHYQRSNETQGKIRMELAEKLAKTESACTEMRLALSELYKDTADYIAINHLGKVHHNRAMQLSRDALSTGAGKGWVSPQEAKMRQDAIDQEARLIERLNAKLAIAVEALSRRTRHDIHSSNYRLLRYFISAYRNLLLH